MRKLEVWKREDHPRDVKANRIGNIPEPEW